MRSLIATFLCLAVATTANAATVTYNMSIDGDDSPSQILAPGTYTLTIEAIVTDNDLTGGGVFGGLLQSAFNLDDTADAITFDDVTGGFLGGPDGTWDSTANGAFDSHFRGTILAGGNVVLAETGAIAPGDFTAQFADIGANTFSFIASGPFTYDGSFTTLELSIADPFGGDILVSELDGSSIVGGIPTAVNGDSIVLGVPEPGTIALAGLAGIGLLFSRRRK